MEKTSLAQQATRKFSSTSSYQRNNSSGQNTFQRNKPTEPFVPRKENEAKPIARQEVKYKEPGLCKYCGAKWFFGHKCPQYKALNLMTADEEDSPDSDQLQDHNSSEETSQLPTSPTEQEQWMQIFLQAIHGKNFISAFTVKVHIGGKVGTALVEVAGGGEL
jgi:hypothetical protein